jgi:hypothetical protein
MVKQCPVCLAEFHAKMAKARYCSDRCRKRASRSGLTASRVAQLSPAPAALVETVRGELEVAGKLGTSLGAMCLPG